MKKHGRKEGISSDQRFLLFLLCFLVPMRIDWGRFRTGPFGIELTEHDKDNVCDIKD